MQKRTLSLKSGYVCKVIGGWRCYYTYNGVRYYKRYFNSKPEAVKFLRKLSETKKIT